jgi:hypothetical protein
MASTKELQAKYINNLDAFISSLPSTFIMFVFFEANKLHEPIVSTTFGKFGDYYIVPGQTKGYCYAYQESQIKYLVTDLQVKPRKGPITLYNVKLERLTKHTNPYEITNIGNHIDFSIQKSKKDVFFKVHYTAYTEKTSDLSLFNRDSSRQCNFLLDTDLIMSKDFASNTNCVDMSNYPLNKLSTVFRERNDSKLIQDFCKNSINSSSTQARDRIVSKRYKTISIIGAEFIKFMADTLIGPLIDQVGITSEYVYQYYDEQSMLEKNSSKSIQYVIEFGEDKVVVFAVSAHRAMKACWAEENKAIASEKEKKCLKQWHTTCKCILKTDFSLQA